MAICIYLPEFSSALVLACIVAKRIGCTSSTRPGGPWWSDARPGGDTRPRLRMRTRGRCQTGKRGSLSQHWTRVPGRLAASLKNTGCFMLPCSGQLRYLWLRSSNKPYWTVFVACVRNILCFNGLDICTNNQKKLTLWLAFRSNITRVYFSAGYRIY
jgi:hypothetical protein